MSIRAYLELALTTGLVGLLIWQLLTAAALRESLASQKALTLEAQLRYQAADTTSKSCQTALVSVQRSLDAVNDAAQSAYAASDKAIQAASGRLDLVRSETRRLLMVRPEGDDCQTASGLARSAWEEGQ